MIKISLYILFLLIFIVIIESIRENRKCDIKNILLSSNKISRDFNFLYLSDFHNNNSKNIINTIVDTIEKNNIDTVIFGGDIITYKKIFSKNLEYNNFVYLMDKLSKYNLKIYYGIGNHESRIHKNKHDEKIFYEFLKKYNICLIDNECIQIDNKIKLYGLNLEKSLYKNGLLYNTIKKRMKDSYLLEHIGNIDKTYYNMIICHNPNFAENCIEYGFDMVLSGHLHGGLVRIPFLGAVISPEWVLFPKYSKGLYKYKNKNIIVSGGAGNHTYNIRVNNKPEIYIIKIKSA